MSKDPRDQAIGQRIRHRRWVLGMTQQDLASAVGVKFQQIQKYESGINRVTATRLYDIAEVLGMSLDYFVAGISKEPKPEPKPKLDPALEKAALEIMGDVQKIESLPVVIRIRNLVRSIAGSPDNDPSNGPS